MIVSELIKALQAPGIQQDAEVVLAELHRPELIHITRVEQDRDGEVLIHFERVEP
jgi:hypothetical protein